ncbi:hypothetical protein [Corticibacter populi]|uniref:hypothetical protein n=1 Tax=Corticibacter populi TaxID=1550736 RepID=UPI001F5F64C9|nr:hypothetical protein [Corticibacter populi]
MKVLDRLMDIADARIVTQNLLTIFSWVTQEVKNAVGKTPVAAQTGCLGKAGNAALCIFDLQPFGLPRQARAAV